MKSFVLALTFVGAGIVTQGCCWDRCSCQSSCSTGVEQPVDMVPPKPKADAAETDTLVPPLRPPALSPPSDLKS